ncbi:MAG TPA: S41 family peptidase [Sphingobacteriaceae bacterium]|nr:S41 family peptidase [Sphingobacteriaceae bacterium]
MKKHFLLSGIACFFFLMAYSQENLLLRHPAISNNGAVVAFSYQGDIWTVPSAGGRPARLTIHEAYESYPLFSPDGTSIAFTGSRYGNNDIFIMPVEGGLSKRLTHHSAADNIASWKNDDTIIFTTSREFRQIERDSEMYSIPLNGGTEQRMTDILGFEPVSSPGGRFIAFTRGGSNPVAREDYKGSSDREIWIMDTKNKSYNKLPLFTTNDIMPRWSSDNILYFLSSNSGTYNLYKIGIDNNGKASGQPQQITNYKDEAIRHYGISKDASTIVFEKDMNLYLLKTDKGQAEKIDIRMNADDRLDASESKILSNGATEYALTPNAKLLAYTVRGEVFIKEIDKEKTSSVNVSNHAYRDMNPVWLNDSALVFSSDRTGGNFNLFMVRSIDTNEVNLFRSLKPGMIQITNTSDDETSPVVSHDGKKIAYIRGKGKLIVADISGNGQLKNEKILGNSWSAPSGITWSPDNKWLAYAQSDLYANYEIFVQAADNSTKPVNITMHPRTETSPIWSPDGSKLGFLSSRNNLSNDVWFVWLKKEDWEKVNEDWQDDPSAEPASSGKTLKAGIKPVQIDFEGISERTVQVTSFPGNEGAFTISKDGQTFFYTATTSSAKGRDLYSIKWDGKELKELTKGGSNPTSPIMDKEGKSIYFFKQGGSLARIDTKTSLQDPLPYSARLKIDYPKEKEQVFEEAWRTMRDQFYDPKMHGYDWKALHNKYKERAVAASTSSDFRDMFNLMLGELNSSHMGFTPAERTETQREITGLLGAELMPVAGGMRVVRVISDSPASRTGSRLIPGDIITAVNGEKIKNNENFFSFLTGTVNQKVLLLVKGNNGTTREVVIRPTASEAEALYNEWVFERRKLVNKYSNGRLGYIHIQAMDIASFEETEREFTAAGNGKDGLIVDVRYNGGGNTTDYLMTVLNYKQHAYAIPRGASEDLEKDKLKFREYYPVGERLVYAAWMKPSIAICNESSYSNAEIFSHAYKQLGIGKLVGTPTNGSVISTGAKVLIDGSTLRLPGRGWFVKATDKNQELGAAEPDILIENSIDYIAKGIDEQLKVAVDELLKQLPEK